MPVTAAESERVSTFAPPYADIVHIKPSKGWHGLDAREFWHHRELLYFLTWRDIKVRYKQTALGAAWAVLAPFLTMLLFSVVFGHLVHVPSEGVPYPVFSFAALVPWMFFANAMTFGGEQSRRATPNLVTKVYFPRLMLPGAAILGGLVDLAIAFVVLVGMTLVYGIVPGPEVARARAAGPAARAHDAGRGALVVRAERRVPRHSVHPSVPPPAVVLRDADRVSELARSASRGARCWA